MAADENDSFIREVNEDIRQEQLGRLWRLLKPYIIGGAAAIILITAGYESYQYYQSRRQAELGEAYSAALQLAAAGPGAEAFAQLAALEKSDFGGYPMLARFRRAALLAQKGDKAAAVKAFDALAADGSLPKPWRQMASVRAAYILVDSGTERDVAERVQPLAGEGEPMRFAAREALGLAAWKAGKMPAAAGYFNRNYSDPEAGQMGFAQRAAMMISLISSESGGDKDNAGGGSAAGGAAPQSAAPAAGPRKTALQVAAPAAPGLREPVSAAESEAAGLQKSAPNAEGQAAPAAGPRKAASAAAPAEAPAAAAAPTEK